MNSPTIQEDQCLKLFPNCIPVKGKSRSIICDLQREKLDFIPNELVDFLDTYNGNKIKDIRADYDEESQEIITEYISFLHNRNYIFFCTEKEVEWFPDLEIVWDSPSVIENAIIDIDQDSKHDFRDIFSQLNELGCIAIELRFFQEYKIEELRKVLLLLKKHRIESIYIKILYTSSYSVLATENLIKEFPRLRSLLIHSFPLDRPNDLKSLNQESSDEIEYTVQEINSSDHCGFISPIYFRLNITSFSESKLFNNCLNRKISIDAKGEIRNCPAMPLSYGDSKSKKLASVLDLSAFKKVWTITKDQIEICKTCEFRYICSDCRAFTQNKSNALFSKPLKCSYNPETMKWGA